MNNFNDILTTHLPLPETDWFGSELSRDGSILSLASRFFLSCSSSYSLERSESCTLDFSDYGDTQCEKFPVSVYWQYYTHIIGILTF